MDLILAESNFNFKYLWKYFDIHKFLYFLNEKKIYFARSDRFEDPNEGLPENIIRRFYECEVLFPDKEHIKDLNPKLFPNKKEAFIKNQKLIKFLKSEADRIQNIQFISCWFSGDNESFAMWNTYSSPDSVAIRFNATNLFENIDRSLKEHTSNFWIQSVICGFVDYQKVYPPEYTASKYKSLTEKFPSLYKDHSYSAENEFRFIALAKNKSKKIKFEIKLGGLAELDFHIITHPKMEDWMRRNIICILTNYGLEKKLIRSSIKLRTNY